MLARQKKRRGICKSEKLYGLCVCVCVYVVPVCIFLHIPPPSSQVSAVRAIDYPGIPVTGI